MLLLLFTGTLLRFAGSIEAVDYASPLVFNADFYMSVNVEVVRAHVRTVAAATQHWLTKGLDMGLQGCTAFHAVQYIQRYPDLTAAFGAHGYRAAVAHYLNNGHIEPGHSENRVGYLQNGYGGRWTVGDHRNGLYVSASRRMGAAIDSVQWGNKEFINDWDHGRQLQMAMNFPPNGECYNPTEAGGRDDHQNNSTHTDIVSVSTANNILTTEVQPSYWLQEGHHITIPSGSNCQKGMSAVNKNNTYPYPFGKAVELRCSGVTRQSCITFKSTFTIGAEAPHHDYVNMEAPTGYLTQDFTVVRSYDIAHDRLITYGNKKPIVMSTPDDKFAMGVYAPPGQDPNKETTHLYYGHGAFPNSVRPAATNKWNVVYRRNAVPGQTITLHYTSYICIGTTDNVVQCLKSLVHRHSSSGLIG